MQRFRSYADAERFIRAAGHAPADAMGRPIAQARAAQHRYLAFLAGRRAKAARVLDRRIAGPHGPLALRLYLPTRVREPTPIVFLRGGGWWSGTLDTSARTMALICEASGMPVLGVDYRLAPEHRYPVQHEETLAALRWLARPEAASLDLDGSRAVLWGESAGATLAVCAARSAGARAPRIRGLVLFYGNFAGPRRDTRPYSRWVWRQYLGARNPAKLDNAIPLRGPLQGMPPAWIGVGDADPLLADSVELARRLRVQGTTSELRVFPGLPHAFAMMTRILQPALDAVREAALAARQMAMGGFPQPPTRGENR